MWCVGAMEARALDFPLQLIPPRHIWEGDPGAKGQVVGAESLNLAPAKTVGFRSLVQTVSPASVLVNPGRQPCPCGSTLSEASTALALWTVIFLNL